MNAEPGKSTYGFICGVSLLFIGLVSSIGCSQQAASKPEQATPPQKVEAKREPSKATPTKPQVSSLEAFQKGTLGKGAEAVSLQDVNFDFDRYDLRPDAREILKKHATWLKANPQVKVTIEGHCDERGTNEYNLALGAKRADSVKRYLVDSGISADRLSTISYGEELPLCKEQDESCWAKNRRGHFAIKTAPIT